MEAAGVTPVVLFLEVFYPNNLIQEWEVLPDLKDIHPARSCLLGQPMSPGEMTRKGE